MTVKAWEVGGEFHSPVETPRPFHPWPRPAVWYALGRHAVEAVVELLRVRTLWLPDYFCHEVAVGWKERVQVRTYEDDPRWAEPRWETIGAGRGDVVLAVDYFGARTGSGWEERRAGADWVLLVDHSHDPFSPWAVSSSADYAFSSLRKTLPVPDGGILWSPRDLDLPPQPRGTAEGSELKLVAMLLKGRYLEAGGGDDVKERFRRLQIQGEEQLARAPVAAASPAAREAVIGGAPLPWRVRRSDNAVHLLGLLTGLDAAEPVFDEWPAGAAPLGVVLAFPSETVRQRVRERLREAGVYCPVHWQIEQPASERVRDLSTRVLTVPTDWRYTAADMERVASILREAETRV
ncbi:MAG: hypothetical protein ICV67_08200 [Thermoleophilia bacterium]|nr:hypothetical protein [Thermoleophilia bacterium]